MAPAKPREKVLPKPMPVASPTAPVPTRNRYDILSEHILPASNSTRVSTSEDYPIALFIKPTKLSKKRRGNKDSFGSTSALSATSDTSASKDPEKTQKRSISSRSSTSTSPRTSSETELIRPGGYEHPWSHICTVCTHNTVCNFHSNFHEDIKLINTQLHLDEFLSNCNTGVGGQGDGVGGLIEVSGKDVGGIGGFLGPSGEKAGTGRKRTGVTRPTRRKGMDI